GLLYDDDACRAATALTAGLSFGDRLVLRAAVPRAGVAARLPDGRSVLDAARELVAFARAGLARLAPDEVRYLAPVEEIAASGRSGADRVRDLWRAAAGDRGKVIAGLAL